MMQFDIFTILPEVMQSYLAASMLGRARQAGHVAIHLHNLRDFAHDRHRTTDDTPYGGGGGMVMKPEPIFEAVEAVLGEERAKVPIILLSPQGRVLTQAVAGELSAHPRLALVCGRYEGVDERVRAYLATDEISIGDYVLTGGELPALVLIDAVVRLLPGALGDEDAAQDDSHASGLLEYPHYTRPPEYRGWRVPDVLLSGDHARIREWRRQQSLLRTLQRRPDLVQTADLTDDDRRRLQSLAKSEPSSSMTE
ncbi:MAG TPA: tRNA (guanosine(37)-N1)-methyltransferase TrmD [Anaerolineales bacterium]|nr:tRNA (guanosine(37)-N1)-methyltransferase TrmD [Anaerolineales bacterium]